MTPLGQNGRGNASSTPPVQGHRDASTSSGGWRGDDVLKHPNCELGFESYEFALLLIGEGSEYWEYLFYVGFGACVSGPGQLQKKDRVRPTLVPLSIQKTWTKAPAVHSFDIGLSMSQRKRGVKVGIDGS
ncbi:hypothetical protein CC1G_12083 [Coprinopsis cinerea okayama7|uniref:Uncharacterized protein n=1 Tax=Coprinopsis cinerea (strain Okayama-7 / 130 / ATCC MYA-4618 / FGSC 9003) TaxID=240176 RepID=A8N0F2_COPC7|nr:hypothetical protein CC1G_12083 [Coprinopsis cinerea okayama7\|eukprot:XP_001828353.2 hypothetical protein CC1G_12083 [Coprinopsis cinerea okayama7\